MNAASFITLSPDVQSGTPVFAGTRVPVKNLFDYLRGGDSIAEFLHDFPSVSREQVDHVYTTQAAIEGADAQSKIIHVDLKREP